MLTMKKIFALLILFMALLSAKCMADENYGLRDYTGLELSIGTFIPVVSTEEISTLYSDIGSKFEFISTNDMYISDTNVIPKNSEFYGYIEKLNEPVLGTNASMIIRIAKVKLPDGFEMPVKGYIYSSNNNLIGGELAPPSSYEMKPSMRQGEKDVCGYVPGPARQMGKHTVLIAGSDLLIVLSGPLYITHTVTN